MTKTEDSLVAKILLNNVFTEDAVCLEEGVYKLGVKLAWKRYRYVRITLATEIVKTWLRTKKRVENVEWFGSYPPHWKAVLRLEKLILSLKEHLVEDCEIKEEVFDA